jgi:transcriptional regulator with XRE-family HTH domain
MISLITVSKAQQQLVTHVRSKRLSIGLTQAGLAKRAGVKLPTLRKFEQKGLISLESFLKLLMVLGGLENLVEATKSVPVEFLSIDDVLKGEKKPLPKRGKRT